MLIIEHLKEVDRKETYNCYRLALEVIINTLKLIFCIFTIVENINRIIKVMEP